MALWRDRHPLGPNAIDTRLHAERVAPGGARRRQAPTALAGLPDGAFALLDGEAWLVRGDALLRWTPAGSSPGFDVHDRRICCLTIRAEPHSRGRLLGEGQQPDSQ